MFAKFSFVAVALSIASLAAAIPTPQSAGQCNTGPIQCCNSVQKASTPAVSTLIGLLGAVVGDVDAMVGVNCSPLTVGAGGGSSCTAEPVCCEGNSYNGLIVIGCSPINISL